MDLNDATRRAHRKADQVDLDAMSDDEVWQWLDALPSDEVAAILIGCMKMQERDAQAVETPNDPEEAD